MARKGARFDFDESGTRSKGFDLAVQHLNTMEKKTSRCWPGYTPVPGKKRNEQGSCRPKAKSKLRATEQSFRKKRERQLDEWEEQHPGKRRSAAQHLRKPTKGKAAKTGATKRRRSTASK
jgi:hypothetical protein